MNCTISNQRCIKWSVMSGSLPFEIVTNKKFQNPTAAMEAKRRRTFSFSSPQLHDESSSPSLPILNNLSTNLLNSNILDSSNDINTTPRAASPAKKVFTLGDQNASNSSLHINYTSHASLSNAASVNVWSLLKGDLYASEYETSQDLKRERVYNFIHVPEEMEKMMVFGFFICLDAFLTMLTIFPMRVCLACFNFLKCFLKENGYVKHVRWMNLIVGAL